MGIPIGRGTNHYGEDPKTLIQSPTGPQSFQRGRKGIIRTATKKVFFKLLWSLMSLLLFLALGWRGVLDICETALLLPPLHAILPPIAYVRAGDID